MSDFSTLTEAATRQDTDEVAVARGNATLRMALSILNRFTAADKTKLGGVALAANRLIPYKIGNIYRAFAAGSTPTKPGNTEGTVTVSGITVAPTGWRLTRPEATAALPYVYDCHVYGYTINGVFGWQFGTPNRTDRYTDLSVYAPLASPALTGTPTTPTATVGTNTTQVASTGYVVGQIAAAMLAGGADGVLGTVTFDETTMSLVFTLAGQSTPLATVSIASLLAGVITGVATERGLQGGASMGDVTVGIAAAGVTFDMLATSTVAAVLDDAALTGTPTGPTAVAGTDTTQLATTAYVQAATGTAGGLSESAVDDRIQVALAAAVTGNTETGIAVTHNSDGTIDFVVAQTPTHTTEQYAALKTGTDLFGPGDFTSTTHGVAFGDSTHTATLPNVAGAVRLAVARLSSDPAPTFFDVGGSGQNQFGALTQAATIMIGSAEYDVYEAAHALEYGGSTVEFR